MNDQQADDGEAVTHKRQERRGNSWTTQDETAFLAGLGTYNVGSEKVARGMWLEQYLAAMPLRAEWGIMDTEAIQAECKRLLLPSLTRRMEHFCLFDRFTVEAGIPTGDSPCR